MPGNPERNTMGVGVDIERVVRFRRELGSSSLFISRAFTRSEREYCMSKADPCIHFAGIFAAKEAAYKATIELTKGKLSMLQFEVVHGRNGVPKIRYKGTESEPKRIVIKISVSHTTDEAVAVALALLPSNRLHTGYE